ncbi:acetyltransferase [Paenibacillus tengchongensis]|uniref:acetyltransferase n=1 Tax=Paenibacillus tengchongensis TaxID=2608684 RepID=UPI00124F0C69|nr:acetyltransferase [Paenibacillus tengchongensis]
MTITVTAFQEQDYPKLVEIWYKAVRATHHFLTEADFDYYHQFVEEGALRTSELWVAVDGIGALLGFIGVEGQKIDTLFVDPQHFGRGTGRRLIAHIEALKGKPLQVDVNEQNEAACRFYLRCGFKPVGRSESDDSGRPYPLIHMAQPE